MLAYLAALLLYAFIRLAPYAPPIINTTLLDESWMAFLHYAWNNTLQAGKDWIFTYGPYGILGTNRFHDDTIGMCVTLTTFMLAALLVLFWRTASVPSAAKVFLWVVLVEGARAFQENSTTTSLLTYQLAICLVFFSWNPERRQDASKADAATLLLAVTALALGGLIRFGYMLVAITSVAFSAAAFYVRRRPGLGTMAVLAWMAASAILWAAAGQHFSNIPNYLRMSIEIASGYRTDMSFQMPAAQIVWYGMGMTALAGGWVAWTHRRDGLWALLGAAGLLGMLFLTFRSCMVRHGGLQGVCLLSCWALFIALVGTQRRSPMIAACGYAGVVALLGLFLSVCGSVWGVFGMASRQLDSCVRDATNLSFLRQVHSFCRLDYRRNANTTREYLSSLGITNSVDIYPNEQLVLIEGTPHYRPRPVFQLYTAYTPALSAWNARHLRDNGPGMILFNVDAIDQRFPTSEDSQSWEQILAWYDPTRLFCDKYLVLERRNKPRDLAAGSASTVRAPYGAPIGLPACGPFEFVKARIKTPRSLAGHVASLFVNLPSAELAIQDASGNWHGGFRLPIRNGEAGFLLSPCILTRDDMRAVYDAFAGNSPWPEHIRSISVTCGQENRDAWAFSGSVSVTFEIVGDRLDPRRRSDTGAQSGSTRQPQ